MVACVGGGQIKCRVILDRGGYVPGENILVTAFISNASNVTIKRTKASLTEVREILIHFQYTIYTTIYLFCRPLSTWPVARQCKQRSAPWLCWCAVRYVRVARMSGTTTVCMCHRCHPLICRVVISSKSPTMCSLSSNPSPWRRKLSCNCPSCWPHIPSAIMPTMYRIHGPNRC